VIHTGTTNDGEKDLAAVIAMLEALKGTGKVFIYTSGVWVLGNTGDTIADESTPVNPVAKAAWRPGVEQAVLSTAKDGVRAVVIRPAVVYGRGGGIPGELVQFAKQAGAARYVGDGANRWPFVHVEDLADLYVRAAQHAKAGTLLYACDGPSVRLREVAEAASFAAGAAGRVLAWPIEEARGTLGGYADALALDQQVSGERAKTTLGWTPHGLPVLDELRFGSYALPVVSP
jgi:nucleoside-diphosphate-sugar epimerase